MSDFHQTTEKTTGGAQVTAGATTTTKSLATEKTPLFTTTTQATAANTTTGINNGNNRNGSKIWDDTNTTTIPVAILNFTKLLLGAAMLSLSWTFAQATFFPGLISLWFCAGYAFICILFILHACELTQVFEYTALLRFTGSYWETAATVILVYVTLSCLLSYIILIADFITFGLSSFDLRFNYDRQIYILLFGFGILLPLSLLRSYKSLKFSSVIGLIANFYCVTVVVVYALQMLFTPDFVPGTFGANVVVNTPVSTAAEGGGGPASVVVWNEWSSAVLIVTNVASKAFVGHYVVPPMYEELRDRSPKRMTQVLVCSFIIVSAVYSAFAVSGYYLFGSVNTQGDILNSFTQTEGPTVIVIAVVRFAMAVSIIATYPMVFKSYLKAMEDKFFNKNKGHRYNFVDARFQWHRHSFIIASMVILVGIGLVVDNVGIVSSIEGAITVLGIICLFPLLIAWKVGSPQLMQRHHQRIMDSDADADMDVDVDVERNNHRHPIANANAGAGRNTGTRHTRNDMQIKTIHEQQFMISYVRIARFAKSDYGLKAFKEGLAPNYIPSVPRIIWLCILLVIGFALGIGGIVTQMEDINTD